MSSVAVSYLLGNPLKKKDTFGGLVSEDKEMSWPLLAVQLLNSLVFFYALYLAFGCKKSGKGGSLGVLAACCCAPFYVAYRLAVPCV